MPTNTTPLDWRAHLTEEEADRIETLDASIDYARWCATNDTADRETIRRRVTRRVKARIKREKK